MAPRRVRVRLAGPVHGRERRPARSVVCVVCVCVWACTNARPAVGGAQTRLDGAGPRAGRGARRAERLVSLRRSTLIPQSHWFKCSTNIH